MPYKCSVKLCRSNYDSTHEKVSVFQFPVDAVLRNQWMQSLNLSKVTNSSRVCIKHFDTSDVDTSTRRSLLKPKAVPVRRLVKEETSVHTKPSEISLLEEVQEIRFEVKESPDEGDKIDNFDEFVEGLEDFQSIESWNIFIHPFGVCLYRLSTDDDFENVCISYKILINKNMLVKVFNASVEASNDELNWLLKDPQLRYWSQFSSIIDHYHNEPEIKPKQQPDVYLNNAFSALDSIRNFELQDKVETLKVQILAIYQQIKFNPGEEEILYNVSDDQEESSIVEEFLEDEVMLESDVTIEPQETIEHAEEFIDDNEQEVEYESPLKCKNCFITFLSGTGLFAHQKTCKTPITNVNINTRKLKVPLKLPVKVFQSDKTVFCDICGKSFCSIRSIRDHMKMHNKSLRKKCPFCDIVLFSGIIKRHIDAVHNKLKPHLCSLCGKSFSTSSLKNDHEMKHITNIDMQEYLVTIDDRPRYLCPKCPMNFDASPHLRKHLEQNCRTANKKRVYRYPCNFCGRNYITKIQAANHMQTAHNFEIGNVEKFCFECNDEFEDYVTHVRIHSCNFGCSFCGKPFLTQAKALVHEKNQHADETVEDRPFKCQEKHCSLSFKNVHHLKSHHQAIHTQQDREFNCEVCNRKFAQRALLTAHSRSHIKDYSMFPCNFDSCDRRFKRLNNLKDHCLREHNNAEIYLCNYEEKCIERFKMLSDLKSHRQDRHGVTFNTHKYFS